MPRHGPAHGSFNIIAAIATAAQAGAVILLHLLPTGYSPVRDAVSDYGIGRYRAWFWTQAVAGGVAGLALAIALAETTPSIPTLVILAASELGSALEHQAAWHDVKGWLTTLPWVMTGSAIGVVLALRAPRLHLIFGLIERLFYVSSIAWFLIVSIELTRIAG
jgi:Protein of unknown function (DUF998)